MNQLNAEVYSENENTLLVVRSATFVFVGMFGVFINIVGAWGLFKCENIEKMVCRLMTFQCSINILGLFPKIVYSPFVAALKKHLLPIGPLRRLPGAIIIFSLYSGFMLQTCMAVTRLVVFHTARREAYSKKTCNLVTLLVVAYGSAWFILVLNPCCVFEICPSKGLHRYTGYNKQLLSIVAVINDMITFPTMAICYIGSLAKMKNLRSAAQSERLTWNEVKHEVKVLIQFLLISSVWALHVGFFRMLQFKVIEMNLWYVMTKFVVCNDENNFEVNRYIFFCIDPIVYFIFIQELRDVIRGKIFKEKQEAKYGQKRQVVNIPMSDEKYKKRERQDDLQVEEIL